MKTTWQTFAAVTVAVLAGSAGGCGSPSAVTTTAETLPLIGMDVTHHVGAVVEGTKIEHSFTTQNNFAGPIVIADEADIEKNCGCTTLELSARRLAPGEKATIRVRVDTTGKAGRFHVGGLVRWRTDDGRSWPVSMSVEGTAKTILAAQPTLVQFSPADVATGKVQEVLVFNSFDVDWSKAQLSIEPPYAELAGRTAHADHVRLLLRPTPPSEAIEFGATLRISARTASTEGEAKICTLDVPLQGAQSIRVQVSPRVVFASWSQEVEQATARFLVRGLASEHPASITSISCDGFQTAWVTKDMGARPKDGPRTLQVELNLSEPADSAFDSTRPRRVRIALADGESLEVPVYFVLGQNRS